MGVGTTAKAAVGTPVQALSTPAAPPAKEAQWRVIRSPIKGVSEKMERRRQRILYVFILFGVYQL